MIYFNYIYVTSDLTNLKIHLQLTDLYYLLFLGDYLRVKYEEATKVKLNKRGRLQVKDSRYRIPTAHDLIYLDESPDWCRTSYLLQWPGN